ncbi:MAG: hypothetical protein ACREBS_05925 [Nitrososphaerales archaeon]
MSAVSSLQTGASPEIKPQIPSISVRQFSRQIGEDTDFLRGKPLLLEVDPSSPYEKTVKDFADEFSSSRVFIFTQRSSRIYKTLSSNPNFSFFASSTSTSYPKKSVDRPNEFIVPQNDLAIYLDLMSKTLESSEGSSVVFIFDSISDMIISSGFPPTYKFLKSALEMLGPEVTCLFLSMPSIHDSRVTATIRSMFSNHLVNANSSGVKLTKKL